MDFNNLKILLKDFPHIFVASENDNDEILSFYCQTELVTKSNNIIYMRGENFFSFLKERSQHFLVLLLRDDNNQIQGLCAISFRQGYINGKITTVGYLGDLRVNMNRKLIREWRKFYTTFLKDSHNLPETLFCRYYQTALMSENNYSKNNLANTKIANLSYKELAPYQMINIIGFIGSSTLGNKHFTIRWATNEDKKSLITFLQGDHKNRLFGHEWSTEFDHRLKEWNNFLISDFIVVFNVYGEIIAVTSIWNPISTKQILIPHISFYLKFLSVVVSNIPGIKLKPLPVKMKPIEILYLNQISFSLQLTDSLKAMIFKGIVKLAFTKNFNMLSYCEFTREGVTQKTKGLITQKNNLGFYTVHFKNDDGSLQDELFLNSKQLSPAFDMALV